MRIPCAIVRDLLPLYAEKLVEPETEALVKEHLEACPDCRQRLSELTTEATKTVDTARPLLSLKKAIRKRRWYTAIVAALCVFIVVYTWFFHADAMHPVAWIDGLVTVKGIENRPSSDVYAQDDTGEEAPAEAVPVLVLQVNGRITGIHTSKREEADGTKTVLLQGWSSHADSNLAKDDSEILLSPVPDRVIYADSQQQKLLWGVPLSDESKSLAPSAFDPALVIALVLAPLSGIVWLLLRKYSYSRIPRQIFFAPLSYLAARSLTQGCVLTSLWMELGPLVITVALYLLLTCLWQLLLLRKAE
ncbi:MAG: zf-HC2 domain-containing protein [Clostridia bacterium]|nr:zf-HC2 domain-containing protein [Clostridia bacterium]